MKFRPFINFAFRRPYRNPLPIRTGVEQKIEQTGFLNFEKSFKNNDFWAFFVKTGKCDDQNHQEKYRKNDFLENDFFLKSFLLKILR